MPSDNNLRIDYIEFPAADIEATKRFYQSVFNWTFTDYGPDYTSFTDGRLSGGFFKNSERPGAKGGAGAPLIVIYAVRLRDTKSKILEVGGTISRETFNFPGGHRFHFRDPAGNELAVWSETDA